jgi:hypothetical protein
MELSMHIAIMEGYKVMCSCLLSPASDSGICTHVTSLSVGKEMLIEEALL